MKKLCLILMVSLVSVLFLFAENTAVNNADLVVMPEIPAEFLETAEDVAEFITETDIPPVRPRRVSTGKFNFGASFGINVHNGTYKDLNDNELKIKATFASLKINAAYKLNSPVVIYGNFVIGFPKWIELDGITHDQDKHWDNAGTSNYDLSKGFTSFNIGAAYIFKLNGFDILAGGGLHSDTLEWDEEHLKGGTKERREYTFQNWGINLHLEGQMELSDTWILNAVISPSFSFSSNYEELNFKNNSKDSAHSDNKDGDKANCDISLSIGALYRF